MFAKGSRYRNLPQSPHLTAKGEWLLSAELRFTPEVTGQFLHPVGSRERLDLLAFKYYSDPLRWWLIADANPEFAFPPDLLDTSPMATEELALAHAGYFERASKLIANLGGLATVRLARTDPFASAVTIEYTAGAVRGLVRDAIRRLGLRVTSSVPWSDGSGTAFEAFEFEDAEVKRAWNDLVTTLAALPGMREAASLSAGETMRVEYNRAQLPRDRIVQQIERFGFAVVPRLSRTLERLGQRIAIPPNQAV